MRLKNKLVLFVSVLILLLNVFVAFAEDQTVTVTGVSEIVNNNLETAKKKALADAFRNAVEKGLGVWVKSETEVQNFELKKDQILTRASGYVTQHEIIKEGQKDGIYSVTIKAKVAVDKIGADFKQLVARVKTQMGNPSITFVLTTWESRGIKTSVNYKQNTDKSLDIKASEGVNKVEFLDTPNQSYLDVRSKAPNMSVQTSSKLNKEMSVQIIDESVWKKYTDMTIIDSFQQEFLEKGFDLKATDNARQIALSESLAVTSINVNDRKAIRDTAEKEGANFVARGEAKILDITKSDSTGNYEASVQVGVEIIDVNSGDIIGSYSNTASSSNNDANTAKSQAIKKVAIIAAKSLAGQTIDKWQDRSLNGKQFVLELTNITNIRKQKLIFIKAVESVAQVTSQTSPAQGILLLHVLYKGEKNKLGEDILSAIGSKSGFSENEFDGPGDDAGMITFKFIKK